MKDKKYLRNELLKKTEAFRWKYEEFLWDEKKKKIHWRISMNVNYGFIIIIIILWNSERMILFGSIGNVSMGFGTGLKPENKAGHLNFILMQTRYEKPWI